MAEQLNLTNPEPEEYILTPEDEKILVENKIKQLKSYAIWKMEKMGYNADMIEGRLKEIIWEDEFDKQELFLQANASRHQDNWHKEQRQKEKDQAEKNKKALIEKCTAKYMFMLMKWTSENTFKKRLIVNDHNKKLITALCFFLSNDERFEKELRYSFEKGILIRGISGLGKTHLVRCVEKNELFPIRVLSMIDIADEIKQNGEYEIPLGESKIIYLDDVGTEEATINHYGTKINFFKQFIETIYLRNQNKSFRGIMISTNNSFAEMEERYGFRVRSRIKDMFNIIDVTGEDMRGSEK